MPTTNFPYLTELILDASTISEADKQRYVLALQSEDVSDEMTEEIARAFAKESKACAEQVEEIDAAIDHNTQKQKSAGQRLAVASEKLVKENEKELNQATTEFTGECKALEREVSTTIETEISLDDQAEADSIRDSLKS